MESNGPNERMSCESSSQPRARGGEVEEEEPNVLDLGSFMNHYYRVRDQLWPLGRLLIVIDKTRRYERERERGVINWMW